MSPVNIGILREGKNPPDRRSPFTPEQILEIEKRFPDIKIFVQNSSVRCFSDWEYTAKKISVVPDISYCNILMGIKEVPIGELLSDKTYFFFSHTLKKQPHNQNLIQAALKKNIRLIDYETLTDTKGNRLVAFGRFAGIIGTYNALQIYGVRNKLYDLRSASILESLGDLKNELSKISLPSIKIALTGRGRVGKGAAEILQLAGINQVSPLEYLKNKFPFPVFTQLGSNDYTISEDGTPFDSTEFHLNPSGYKSTFLEFANASDILIAGSFWNPGAPKLFTKEEMKGADFRIRIIADISCDLNGAIPSTIKTTTINDPVYDYNRATESAETPYSSAENVTVMAIDNLPCSLPRDASEQFGKDLIERILPLFISDPEDTLARATITLNGELTEGFDYLRDYAFPIK